MNATARTRTASNASVSAATPSNGFYQRLLFAALSKLPRGQLHIELPGGGVHLFGHHEQPLWHTDVSAPAALAIPQNAIIRVRSHAFFKRCVLFGDIGFAESYLDGEWETPDITAVIAWFILNHEHAPTLSGTSARGFGLNLLRIANRLEQLLRPNSRRTASRNIREHYDLSNEFFALWLDPSMMYSSARWSSPELSLAEAQRDKNDTLCRKLNLTADDHVLEIGTGWGGWSLHAARTYGCRVTSLTISEQQFKLARERVAAAGLADKIEVRLQDYRDLPVQETFSKLVSIEMLEAVGHDYLDAWCGVVSRALKPGGLLALQFITCADSRYEELRRGVDFIQKHIFPGSLLLSLNRINSLLAKRGGFVLQGIEHLGQDYARTLRTWRVNFNERLDCVRELGFDERFIRKWNYYLAYCEAAFALRHISVVQTVHTRPDNLSFS